MASTIRVRAVASGDSTEVQSLIQHPMDSGFVKDSKGQIIPAHHIEVVQFEHGGKTVFTAQWGPAVSKAHRIHSWPRFNRARLVGPTGGGL